MGGFWDIAKKTSHNALVVDKLRPFFGAAPERKGEKTAGDRHLRDTQSRFGLLAGQAQAGRNKSIRLALQRQQEAQRQKLGDG